MLKLTFDTEGGSVIESELLKYPDDTQADRHVLLFDSQSNEVYQAQSGLIGGAFPTTRRRWPSAATSAGRRRAAAGGAFESPEVGGVKLVKTYTLKRGSYVIGSTRWSTRQPPVRQPAVQLVRDGNKPGSKSPFYSTFTGPAVYTDAKKYQKVEFKDIEKGKAEFDKQPAMATWPWCSTTSPAPGCCADTPRDNFVRKVGDNLYAVGMITPLAGGPGATRPWTRACSSARRWRPCWKRSRPVWSWSRTMAGSSGQAAVLAARPDPQGARQLGLVHRGAGGAAEDRVLLARQGLLSMAKMKAINPKIRKCASA
jgi:YidC/Oxa1 family membrane protein insertase